MKSQTNNFSKQLLKWYATNKRDLPWRKTKDPYKIWLSEIMLQQTRVNQGLPYYLKFIERFPTVQLLAGANVQTVLKLWQGLGYYSRARNLHETAKHVVRNLDGKFPSTYSELIKLKGIGEYTAAAISSIAYSEHRAVVDGNVERVLSRYLGIKENIHSPVGKKKHAEMALKFLSNHSPRDFNQAIMDFGALQCVPVNPVCTSCPMKKSCVAYLKNKVGEFPVRKIKPQIRNRYFDYFIINKGSNIYLRKRTANDIWKSLYDFPIVESRKHLPLASLIKNNSAEKILKGINLTDIFGNSRVYVQKLSHQILYVRFWRVNAKKGYALKLPGVVKAGRKSLSRFPLPKVIETYVNEQFMVKNSNLALSMKAVQ
jgi:A/G-specific adenine glycosylase